MKIAVAIVCTLLWVGAETDGSPESAPDKSVDGARSVVSPATQASQDLVLHYDKPAVRWLESALFGNGRLGAMVLGGVKTDSVIMNEDTLWSGWAEPKNDREGARSA